MKEPPKTSLREDRSKSDDALSCGLYLVATPIGNAADMTLRALAVLNSADHVFAEDTRVTAKLLSIHRVNRKLHSYREQNAETAEAQILEVLSRGQSVALVSDAGTPLISDPGQSLVRRVADAGFNVFPVPGASAAIAALSASGLPTARFLFVGFLSTKSGERRREINALSQTAATLIFYEAPGRLLDLLVDLNALLGPREAVVARELTKLHEEITRCPLNALIEHYRAKPEIRGEIVVLVAPPPDEQRPELNEAAIDTRLEQLLKQHPVKDAASIAASEFGLPRRNAYARALRLKKTDDS